MNDSIVLTNSITQKADIAEAVSHATPIVFVVDEDISVRKSLDLLLRFEGWQPETFASAQEFLVRPRPFGPSCLVLDVSLPGFSGLDLQRRLAVERNDMPIVFMTRHGDVPTSVQAMKAGAVEFLMKPFKQSVLLEAVRECLDRSRLALVREMEMRPLRNRYASLTPRERQVMALVVSGLLNKQVGAELGISEITVKAHRGQVMQKMQVNSLADLVKIAERLSPERPLMTSIQLTSISNEVPFSLMSRTTTHSEGGRDESGILRPSRRPLGNGEEERKIQNVNLRTTVCKIQ